MDILIGFFIVIVFFSLAFVLALSLRKKKDKEFEDFQIERKREKGLRELAEIEENLRTSSVAIEESKRRAQAQLDRDYQKIMGKIHSQIDKTIAPTVFNPTYKYTTLNSPVDNDVVNKITTQMAASIVAREWNGDDEKLMQALFSEVDSISTSESVQDSTSNTWDGDCSYDTSSDSGSSDSGGGCND